MRKFPATRMTLNSAGLLICQERCLILRHIYLCRRAVFTAMSVFSERPGQIVPPVGCLAEHDANQECLGLILRFSRVCHPRYPQQNRDLLIIAALLFLLALRLRRRGFTALGVRLDCPN
jgi:hypothetical protein